LARRKEEQAASLIMVARLLAALLTERGNQASWLDARRSFPRKKAHWHALMKRYPRKTTRSISRHR